MNEFLQVAISFPAVIFTALLGFVALFWSLVLIGGSDPHALDFHHDGHFHFDLGDHGGHGLDVGGHGGHGLEGAGHGTGWAAWILSCLNMGSVPVTVIGSSFIMLSWVMVMVLQLYASPALAAVVGLTGAGAICVLCAMLASLVLTAFATRPLRGLFDVQTFEGGEKLIDQVCVISTTHVDEKFGQASFKTAGAPLTLSVRCPRKNKLGKGAQAVIIAYDAEKTVYIVGEL
jgi:hypothetical protein